MTAFARRQRLALADLLTDLPASHRPLETRTTTGELFIHHEDVRRGRPGWEPRALDPAHERAIWRSVRLTGRLALRRLGVPTRVRPDGLEPFEVGERPQVTISGPAGELALFLSGRQRAARVTVDGPAESAERLRTARLGV